jgi:two-component system NtrC family sensor kinase
VKRRRTTSRKPTKVRPTTKSKRGNSVNAARTRRASDDRQSPKPRADRARPAASLQEQLDARTRELNEALEQQKATSEILRAIAATPGDAEGTLRKIAETTARLFDAVGVTFRVVEGDDFKLYVGVGQGAEQIRSTLWADPAKRSTVRSRTLPGTVVRENRQIHLPDLDHLDDEFADWPGPPVARCAGIRTMVGTPLRTSDRAIGALIVYRNVLRPFTLAELQLLQIFADQAVIAIENAGLLSELRESLEQQTATSEVLRVISSSPGELQPVFQAMLGNATRLCEANFGTLLLCDGDALRAVALHGGREDYAEERRRNPVFQPAPNVPVMRALRTKQVQHVADMRTEQAYIDRDTAIATMVDVAGARTFLAVPMLKDDKAVGVIIIYRQEVRPFTDKQIALVQSFAAQAVIAIENARLLNELRQRTADLTEALGQQTATSEVLRVISSSPGELEPVFQAMLENATRICDARFGTLFQYDNELFDVVASFGAPPNLVEFHHKRGPFRPASGTGLDRVLQTKSVARIEDEAAEPSPSVSARLGGARSLIVVPMLKEHELVGAITVYRQEVRPFTDKQVELVQNFATQAVIAIENTRLLNELRESLEQQTATADVLRVISTSPGELYPVFTTILENATRICEAKMGTLFRYEHGKLHPVAQFGSPPELIEAMEQRGPFIPRPGTLTSRMVETKAVVTSDDQSSEPVLGFPAKFGEARSTVNVPMLKDGELVGGFSIYRQEVRPFNDRQVALLQNFAAQAVIAIENTRLLNELRQRTADLTESLEQQTATSEVLKVISSSPGELEPVFQAMLENATRICEAKFGTLYFRDGDGFRTVAMHGAPPAYLEARLHSLRHPGPNTGLGRVVRTKQVVQIEDITADQAYSERDPMRVTAVELGGVRTLLCVPMLKENEVIGAIAIYRDVVRPFTDKQLTLVQNFAAQAVIAIENTRLLRELRQRTDDLSQSLEELRTAQDRLVQTEKLASLGQLTAGIAHEIKNPLNFVNNFSSVSAELLNELTEIVGGLHADDKVREEIGDLSDTLRDNLQKIVQHGKRADSIVKNMLLHSREGSGEHRPVDINAIVEESLNLAYHGARAEKQGFNITLKRSFDPAAGEVDLFPQEITRVLLNLISNGFYAAIKRKSQTANGDFEPTLAAATKSLGDRVEIRIRDNGTGIPPEVKDKMFNPFFTTKPAGEGTGLGLSISHDIIVKQHAGSIAVDTEQGSFTEFKITLPRKAAALGAAAPSAEAFGKAGGRA